MRSAASRLPGRKRGGSRRTCHRRPQRRRGNLRLCIDSALLPWTAHRAPAGTSPSPLRSRRRGRTHQPHRPFQADPFVCRFPVSQPPTGGSKQATDSHRASRRKGRGTCQGRAALRRSPKTRTPRLKGRKPSTSCGSPDRWCRRSSPFRSLWPPSA